MATHKTLQVTFWTRVRDLIKGILLYGTVNWRRASDGLKPPKLSPLERKILTPSKNLEVIKPRENPQAAIIKTLPKKPLPPKRDITAGAIVSEPVLPLDEPPASPRHFNTAPSFVQEPVEHPEEAVEPDMEEEMIVVRRRRRHHRHGLQARRAPRSSVAFGETAKPGLFARLFGPK